MKKAKRQYNVGPNGEKRPVDPIANAVRTMEVALGLTEEEYVEDETDDK